MNDNPSLKRQGLYCSLLNDINISSVLYDCDVKKLVDETAFSDPDKVAWTTVDDSRYSGIGQYGNCTGSVVETQPPKERPKPRTTTKLTSFESKRFMSELEGFNAGNREKGNMRMQKPVRQKSRHFFGLG